MRARQETITFLDRFLLCVVACSAAGCATYWQNRAKDLVDPFGLGLDVSQRRRWKR